MPVHNAVNAPVLSHFGVFCRDLDTMVEFYRSTFDLVLTDRGGEGGHTMPFTLAFLSATRLSTTNSSWHPAAGGRTLPVP